MTDRIDSIDEEILRLLVQDGRRSATEVGRLVQLSPAAAKRRIDRLQRLGVIVGYRAVVNSDLAGSIEAFAEVRFDGQTQVGDIDNAFADIPELVESFTLAGDSDALLRIRARHLDHLKRVIDHIRRTEGVTGTKTLIVLGSRQGPAADLRGV